MWFCAKTLGEELLKALTKNFPMPKEQATTLTVEQKEARKQNNLVYNFLILLCKGNAFKCVERATIAELSNRSASVV